MKVLVTGANGFIGSHLCKKLVKNGFYVRALVRKDSDISKIKKLPIDIVYSELDDYKSLKNSLVDIEIVFHFASVTTGWDTKDYYKKINVDGTKNLLDASVKQNVRSFVYISSFVVELISKHKTNFSKLPKSFNYAIAKLETEKMLKDYHKKENISISIIRPCTVFGPDDSVTFGLFKSLDSGRMIYFGKGQEFIPYVYVGNLVNAIILIGTKNTSGEIYTVTDGIYITQKEFHEKICGRLDVKLSSFSLNLSLGYYLIWLYEKIYSFLKINSKPSFTLFYLFFLKNCSNYLTTDKKLNDLGYKVQIDLDEAIDKCVDWYKMEIGK